MDLHSQKEQLRASIKARLARMSPEDRARESRSLCKRLIAALPAAPGTLCVFYPMTGSEADIREIFVTLLERGWKLFFPRFEGESFRFRQAHTLAALVPGRWGLMEPNEEETLLDIHDVTIALLPGLGFDATGNRIGRGNGGYDRWLKKLRTENPAAKVWGIALDCQMVHEVPREAHDELVDIVITPRGIIDPASGSPEPR